MDKKPLIGVSILAVILLVLGSLSNVVGYQTVQNSQQNRIKERINPRELLFQTIVDIANNKEIQRIILKSQMSKGIFPTSELPVLTKNQLKMMYFLGLILSKIISKSRIQSMVQQYQLLNPITQEEIQGVIEKDATLRDEITQLKNLECDCENNSAMTWNVTIICDILIIIVLGLFIMALFFGGLSELLQLIHLPGLVPLIPLVIICLLGRIIYQIPFALLHCPPIFPNPYLS